MKIAKPIIIADSMAIRKPPDTFIIEKSYKPCNSTARVNPEKNSSFLFLTSQNDSAVKNPMVPDAKACRKVAEMNLKAAKERLASAV